MFGVNTKFGLGLPGAKKARFEAFQRQKKLKEVWSPTAAPPPLLLGMSIITDSMFFYGFPKQY